MPAILGGALVITDEQARVWNASDANARANILRMAGRPDLIPASNAEWVEENFGYLGAILKVPVIKNILERAATEGWSEARVQGAISKTKFWKTHSATERQWMMLKGTDPKEAAKQKAAMRAQIESTAAALGITLAKSRLDTLSEKFMAQGVTADKIQGLVAAEAKFKPELQGGFGSTIDQIKALGNSYLVPISEQTAFQRAQAILRQQDSLEGTEAWMRDLAKARWGHLAEQLDTGAYTVRDLIEPNVQQAAQLLGIDPDLIDFNDPRWQQIIDTTDENGVHRVQTLDETARMVRGFSEYRQTDGARALAAQRVEGIAQRLGKVA